jgi:hypothetical protein
MGKRKAVRWAGLAMVLLELALVASSACGQFVPPRGPSGQDIAIARTQAQATADAGWWTSALVVVAVGALAVACFRGIVMPFLRASADRRTQEPPPSSQDHPRS